MTPRLGTPSEEEQEEAGADPLRRSVSFAPDVVVASSDDILSSEDDTSSERGSSAGSDLGGGGVGRRAVRRRPKRDAVDEVRRYMQERSVVDSRAQYERTLAEAKELEMQMKDDDVVMC